MRTGYELAFAGVMNTPGLILPPQMPKRFRFVITDVNNTSGD